MTGLTVTKDNRGWRVYAGPALITGRFDRKRDAQAWVDAHDHLPWTHFRCMDDAVASDDPIVTVSRAEIVQMRSHLDRTEAELRAHKSLVLDLNDEIVAKYGHGGWQALNDRRGATA